MFNRTVGVALIFAGRNSSGTSGRAGAGWYVAALQALDPDYIVQYAAALERNRSEGTEDPLFVNGDQRAWFRDHYESVARFRLSGQHFRIEEKEKEYVVLRKIHS